MLHAGIDLPLPFEQGHTCKLVLEPECVIALQLLLQLGQAIYLLVQGVRIVKGLCQFVGVLTKALLHMVQQGTAVLIVRQKPLQQSQTTALILR